MERTLSVEIMMPKDEAVIRTSAWTWIRFPRSVLVRFGRLGNQRFFLGGLYRELENV